jgi:hypothetical protein
MRALGLHRRQSRRFSTMHIRHTLIDVSSYPGDTEIRSVLSGLK